jgi:RNA recognition motif-containing protein
MKLFVGNLPYAATEADLTDFFSQAGVSGSSKLTTTLPPTVPWKPATDATSWAAR